MTDKQISPYQDKIYLIGEIVDPMTGADDQQTGLAGGKSTFDMAFANRIQYDGTATDAPVFIIADSVKDLDETAKKGLLASYENLKPIVVIDGSEALINQVLEALGIKEAYLAPSNNASPEIFAVEKEKGTDFRWVLHPSSNSGKNKANCSDNASLLFIDWLKKSGSRLTEKEASNKKEAARLLTAQTSSPAKDGQDLESYVHGYNSTHSIEDGANVFQLSYWIYSLHDFGDDSDWYYVRQEGQLSASGNYSTYEVHDWRGYGFTTRKNYAYSYTFDNWFATLKSPDIEIFRTSPSTESTSTKVTSEMNWGFTGDLGFEGTKPTGNVGLSLDLKNSSEVVITDCRVSNKSVPTEANGRWIYQFREVTPRLCFGYMHFDDPSLLQVSLFQPINQWLWKVKGSLRTNNYAKQFRSQLKWEFVDSHGKDIRGFFLSTYDHVHSYGSMQLSVTLSQPPLIMADQNMSFAKGGTSKAITIAVGGKWTVKSSEPWLWTDITSGDAAHKYINVSVSDNTTGKDRSATLTFTTEHGKETCTTTTSVFQSRS